MLLHPGKTMRIMVAKHIPLSAQPVHNEELLKKVFDQHRNIPDGEQFPERMLYDLRHKVIEQQPVFEGDRPGQRLTHACSSEDTADGTGVKILDQVIQ